MKKSSFVFILLGFSLGHISSFGVVFVQPASAQVFRCSDTTLGQDDREEVRGEDSRSESKVAVGTDCKDANFHEYLNEQMRRGAESRKESDAAFHNLIQRRSCEFYGIHSSECTDPELRRQAQQEDEIKRQRQLQVEREETLRKNVKDAQASIRSAQEAIAFWGDGSEHSASTRKMLPIYEAELQRAEQELKDYLAQKPRQ